MEKDDVTFQAEVGTQTLVSVHGWFSSVQFSSFQSLSHVSLFAIP